MKIEKIKPIPQYMLRLIKKYDQQYYRWQDGKTRFYAYLTKNDGELVKVTVAVKNYHKKWYCKQVAVHGVHSTQSFAIDLVFYHIGGYVVDWYSEGIQKYPKHWGYKNCWGTDERGKFGPLAPVINPEYALKFPEYKYSAADKYHHLDIIKYLRMYEQYPQAELLVKFGLSEYATSKQILRLTSKDKAFRKWLINNREALTQTVYFISTIQLAYQKKKPLDITQRFERFRKKLIADKNLKAFRIVFKNDLERLFNYLDKNQIYFSSYYDYCNACQYIGLDMTQNKNLFPHDFDRWHDIRINQYKAAKALQDEENRKKLFSQFASIAEKYLPLQRDFGDEFIVFIAKSPTELKQEGTALHHCVGIMDYDMRFIKEQSLIFFIRCKDKPDMPFVTVEYSIHGKKILQCHGEYNKRPDDKVLNFINHKWLPYANRKIRKIAA